MTTPNIVFMPHANIQYSQLKPQARKWVIDNCYEKLFDLIESNNYTMAFEASGKTIDVIAEESPAVMQKLRRLVASGRIEPVASPYIHFMLSNVPPELCRDSLIKSLDTWERHTDMRPKIGWNPECGWASYILDVYRDVGFEALVMDADSLLLSFDEVRKATGLTYDVQGHSNKSHLFRIEEYIQNRPELLKFITQPTKAPNGLKMIFRSDCMANILLWYLMGATEGQRGTPVALCEIDEMFGKWKQRIADTGSFIMPYAEDAEYIGSSAYFYVKQFNQARFFEPEPKSVSRFKEIVDTALQAGYRLSTPSQVLQQAGELVVNPFVEHIENGVAWHGGTAKAWANTIYSRIMDPVCHCIFDGIQVLADHCLHSSEAQLQLKLAKEHVASAWVSDSRWPPAPTSPGRFNVEESIADLYRANESVRLAMEAANIAPNKGLYSPDLMQTQIRCIEGELMEMNYFGEP